MKNLNLFLFIGLSIFSSSIFAMDKGPGGSQSISKAMPTDFLATGTSSNNTAALLSILEGLLAVFSDTQPDNSNIAVKNAIVALKPFVADPDVKNVVISLKKLNKKKIEEQVLRTKVIFKLTDLKNKKSQS